MASAIDTANYFLATLGADAESDLTNLKLQKLCAYAQGISLALLNAPLFADEIEAWTHGPVVPTLYYKYAQYGSAVLPASGLSESYARASFTDEQKFIVELTRNYYGGMAAWELRNQSHFDFPGRFGSMEIIPHEAIKKRFLEMDMIKILLNYSPPPSAPDKALSGEEFWNAVHA